MHEVPNPFPDRPLVVVLFGGQSSEHQISCATAGGVLRAIDPARWRVIAVGITPEGQWVPLPTAPEEYDLSDNSGYTVSAADERVAFLPGVPRLIRYRVDEDGAPLPEPVEDLGEVDVVFPLLHGPYGEDGTLQGLLDFCHVRYVGAGVAASAVCQDKSLTKTILKAAGIDVGRWVAFSQREWQHASAQLTEEIRALELPLFVKPCRGGSSLGVSRVTDMNALGEAVEQALRHDSRVIVEQSIRGREVECGVLGTEDGELHASVIGEITVLRDAFYDYQAKYFSPEAVKLTCPADLDFEVSERIRKTAIKAFRAVQAEAISRIDFFYDPDTDDLVLNEINTLPGFTPFSMYPVVMRESGLAYSELVEHLLREALSRPVAIR